MKVSPYPDRRRIDEALDAWGRRRRERADTQQPITQPKERP